MTRYPVLIIVAAIVVAVLGVGAILLGNGLVPTQAEALEKGTYAPWIIVWSMVLITSACAAALSIFLFKKGFEGLRKEANQTS
jgi:hypothetical protein